jgi:diguanylate cyclase
VKGRDTVARYGGEEFALILPETPLVGAGLVAEQIRLSIAASRIRMTTRDETVSNITASFGVACYCAGETPDNFIARADAALYLSKQQGRNRVSIDHPA